MRWSVSFLFVKILCLSFSFYLSFSFSSSSHFYFLWMEYKCSLGYLFVWAWVRVVGLNPYFLKNWPCSRMQNPMEKKSSACNTWTGCSMKLEVSKSSTFVRFEKLVKSLQDQVQHLMSPMAMPFYDSDSKFDGVLWCLPGPEAAVWELLHPGGGWRWSHCAGRLHHQTGCGWQKKGYKIQRVLEALCFWVYNIRMCFLFLFCFWCESA